MYELALYSLRTGACLAVFYLFFKWLLSRETFHRLNRIVVLGAMLLSFVLPLCEITIYRELPAPTSLPQLSEMPELTTTAVAAESTPEPFAWETLVGLLFTVGAAAALGATLYSLGRVLGIIRRGSRSRLANGTVLVRTRQAVPPFSWVRYIVLPEEEANTDEQAILLHESAHLRLHHSWDLLVTDIAGCLQWFNPAMWLLRRELRAIHEYEADQAVLDSGIDARSYQLLIVRKAAGGRWYSVASSFNHSKLKNRINMMLSKKSSRMATAKALVILPLTVVALGAFARTTYVFPEDNPPIDDIVTVRFEKGDSVMWPNGSEPIFVVDGQRVEKANDLAPEQINSISILKNDSAAIAKYGAEAKNGVITITTNDKKSKDGKAATLLRTTSVTTAKGNVETTCFYDDGTKTEMVYVPSQTLKGSPRNISMSSSFKSGDAEPQMKIIIDGKHYSGKLNELKGLNKDDIASFSIYKNGKLYEEGKAQGYDGVIDITTQTAAAQKAEQAGVEAGIKGVESAMKAIEAARKNMSDKEYNATRKQLDEARKQLDAARAARKEQLNEAHLQLREAREQLNKAQQQLDTPPTALKEQLDEVRKQLDESSTTSSSEVIVSGNGTLNTKDNPVIFIDGKKATKKEMKAYFASHSDYNINAYDGGKKQTLKKFGKAGRNNVLEIVTKK